MSLDKRSLTLFSYFVVCWANVKNFLSIDCLNIFISKSYYPGRRSSFSTNCLSWMILLKWITQSLMASSLEVYSGPKRVEKSTRLNFSEPELWYFLGTVVFVRAGLLSDTSKEFSKKNLPIFSSTFFRDYLTGFSSLCKF